jgi:hypothetical protein
MLCFFSRRQFIRCPPRHVVVEDPLTHCSDALHRRCVGSSGAEDPAVKTYLVASTRPSDRPTLPLDQGVGSSGVEDFVLARLCLDSNWASDRPTVSSLRPSDQLVLLPSLLFLCNSSGTSTKWTVGSSDGANFILTCCAVYQLHEHYAPMVPSVHPTMSFLLLFFAFWHVIFLHPWDLEVSTKTC